MNLTLPRYYKVFVSSTFRDLAAHRQQAILGILRAGHMPVALENFTPESNSKRTVISEAMQTCQFYVIILGSRYGTIPEDQDQLPMELRGKSYTEIELELAIKANLPILAFYMDSDEVTRSRTTTEWVTSSEPANVGKYNELRSRVCDGIEKPLARPFSRPEDIFSELFAYFQRDLQSVRGYILEPESRSDVDVILRFSSGNQVARDVVEALGKFSDVDPRLAIAPQKKEALASAFLDLHGDHIERNFSHVFFESGSTITYLARSVSHKLPKRGKLLRGSDPVHVQTNNAFAYLYLWLCSGVMCHPVPEGPPDHTYGGMYGALTDRNRRPDYNLPALERYDPDAFEQITEINKELFTKDRAKRCPLLLAAASGLQLTDHVVTLELQSDNLTGREEWVPSTDADTKSLIRRCRGFHVGSYQNMLFKRCYYLTSTPTIVFIHDDKIDCEVKIGKCHFLFDQGLPWQEMCSRHPLSIWVACERHTCRTVLDKCKAHFEAGGWKFAPYGEASPYPIVIGHNEVFRNSCADADVRVFGG